MAATVDCADPLDWVADGGTELLGGATEPLGGATELLGGAVAAAAALV
jgi:hypothetical protein